ncbi:hypothetical protein V500_05222 [Pseudogymnoascus sp. VKM F-4518 (FW-2643)]|nr:hypothetical protein V500_05222 [Pseudogymnoascus sp. VKM F-4518 (FW-2643)]
MENINEDENLANMLRGKLYYAFTPRLTVSRMRCHHACDRFNRAGEVDRRRLVELWRDILGDKTPLPAKAPTQEDDDNLFNDDAWVDGPIKVDYGTNTRIGKGVYINFNCTFLDTCVITIGARTLIGPNCSFFAASHPLDPFLRNGTRGPELGAPITVGEDCWFGGNVTVLAGVTIGRGVTVGAGSVVTKDVPDFVVVAGNPARVLKKIEVKAPDPRLAIAKEEEAASS